MQCERLISLTKTWYLSVKEETMAPARMVQFIKQHVASCPACQEDAAIQDEIVRITQIILPESKIPKAVRIKQEQEAAKEESARQKESEAAVTPPEKGDEVGEKEKNEEPLAPEKEKL